METTPLNSHNVKTILVEGEGNLCHWGDLCLAIGRELNARGTDYRPGQAAYNILFSLGQAGLPSSWPKLFYRANFYDEVATTLDERFDLVDGYLVPR